MKKSFLFAFLFVIILAGVVALNYFGFFDPPKNETELAPIIDQNMGKVDPFNATYNIDGDIFKLVNGKAEVLVTTDTTTKNTLEIFDEPISADVDSDNDMDSALWLVNDPGGSGKFYYAVLVINEGAESKATNTMFLGDRIAPQTLEFRDGRVVYNFAERKADEPMTAEATVGRSVWVNYDKSTGQIGEWVKDFEGEADPSIMKLNMKVWEWQGVQYSDDKKIVPKDPKKFTISFKEDKTFSASTDCNGIGGNYKVEGNKISFSEMLGTLMYCEGSQENDFKKILENTSSYFFTSKGELVFELKYDSGSAIFR